MCQALLANGRFLPCFTVNQVVEKRDAMLGK
jgi:hypothetical protein